MLLPALARQGLGVLGGVLLALLLFTLLGLLVVPPASDQLEVEMPVSIAMVEATEQQAPEPAAEAAPPPPAEMPPLPPPAPLPSPALDRVISLPEPEIPAIERPQMTQDMQLPELAEIEPQPEPQPDPEPQPELEPELARAPSQTTAEPPSSTQSVADASGEARDPPAASPGEIGSPQPTRRVRPEYPARAQRRGLEGYVEVRFIIQPDGSVDQSSLRVVEARPRHVFDRAALQAIARWQFPEASRPRQARQRLRFRLEG